MRLVIIVHLFLLPLSPIITTLAFKETDTISLIEKVNQWCDDAINYTPPNPSFLRDCQALISKLDDSDYRNSALKSSSTSTSYISLSVQNVASSLSLASGSCQFKAIGTIAKTSVRITPDGWEDLYPSFRDSMRFILTKCVPEHRTGNSILWYKDSSPVDRVGLLIQDSTFEDYQAIGIDNNARQGIPNPPDSIPSSSNQPLSPPPLQAFNDHVALEISNADPASPSNQASRPAAVEAFAQTARGGICARCSSC